MFPVEVEPGHTIASNLNYLITISKEAKVGEEKEGQTPSDF